MKRRSFVAVPLLALAARLRAQPTTPQELAADLPGARLLGSGTMRFLGLHIYDARLWVGAQAPAEDWAAAPLALELIYARSLSGARIAERSLKEMQRQGDIASADGQRWLGAMKQLFPDVLEGDRITGLNLPGFGARFFVNGALKGDLRDVRFSKLFFGIWLAPQTSEPALRKRLLGLPA